VESHFRDDDFGAKVVSTVADVYQQAQVVFRVTPPTVAEINAMNEGTVLVGYLAPYSSKERIAALKAKKITSFAVELIPRISRAQSMDALSSQAAVAGYQTVLIAAAACPKFFPMLTYAAGTIRPARVLVIGAGVAGLQAIATAKRLGAIVEGYDVRPETKEQIESLGAKFVDTGVSAAGSGGYARELTEEEKAMQAEKLGKAVANCDILITTAAIPGKKSPLIISSHMIGGMKQGAIVVDMAAEGGGNCAGTIAGETVTVGSATIIGPVNLPARMPVHASEMYAKNLFNFLSPFIKDGVLTLDWEDEIIAGACLTKNGEFVHEGVKKIVGDVAASIATEQV
jgi:NAD(P) transhydrogenase subunit alpha